MDSLESATIHIVHFSAKQVLVNHLAAPTLSTLRLSEISLNQRILTDLCLTYLSADDFKKPPTKGYDFKDCLNSHPLYRYCVVAWPQHARAYNVLNPLANPLIQGFLHPPSSTSHALWQAAYHTRNRPPHPKDGDFSNKPGLAAEFLAFFGLNADLELFLSGGTSIECVGEFYGTPLQAAVYGGFPDTVALLLAKDANANGAPSWLETPLRTATTAESLPIMKLLLESGADPNFLSVHGNNLSPSALPLMTASANGFYDGVELLLSYKADIDGTDSLHGTALVQAATVGDIKMLQLLIKRGANINETGGIYHSAVNAACYLGHLDCVKFLVETGADLKTVYKHLDGRIPNYGTALHCACDTGNDDIVDYLLSKGADVNSPGADLGTALEVAIYAGRESIALKLLELGAKLVETPGACSEIVVRIISTLSRGEGDRSFRETMEKLAHIRSYRATGGLIHAAAFYGSLPLITALVKAGTPIDLERQPLGTPLMAAIEGNQIEAVKCLLDLGADITYQCEIGTALQVACLRGRLSIVDMLLGLGLDVNSVDIQTGMGSPLQAATIGGHRDVLARLLERGARLNAYYDRDPDDRVGIDSPLCLAAIRGQVEVIELFMNHTPRPTDYDVHRAATEAATEGDGEAIPTLIRCGWNPNSTTGGVVLFHLAYRGRAEEIALLLSHGTPLISSDVGNNALHVAAREGHFNSVRAFLNSPRKFDLEAEGSWGQTALDKAAENGYLEVVKLLVHHGADVDSVADDCLKSSAWAAARNGHVDVVQYLAANGASNVISRSDGTYEYTLSDEPDNDENFSIRVLRYLDSLRKCASLAPFDHCSEARQKVEPAPTAKAETPQRNPQRRFEGPAHLIFDESVELRVSPIVLGEMLSHELGQTLMAYEEQERPPIPIEDSKYDNEEHPGSILEHFIQNLCRISRIARENSQESDDASPEQP